MDMKSGLQIQDVRFLDNGPYSLTVTPGECVGLTGQSGIGKTQFLRAIVDLLPHEGKITLDGVSYQTVVPYQWRKQVSMLPAESRWWFDRVGDHFPDEADDDFYLWLKELSFTKDSMNWRVSRLSTGEKQRFSFLRTMTNRPSFLLLDEPTSALDRHHTTQLEAILADIRSSRQVGLIWISHDLEQLEHVCDRVFRLEKNGLFAL